MKLFSYKTLVLALASVGVANAAGLDRSGQDVSAFLQDGTYAEAVYTYIDANVTGHDNGVVSGAGNEANYVQGKATGNVVETYDFFRYGVKTDVSDRISVGVLYDEPFGAAVTHTGDSNFNTKGADVTVNALTNGRVPSAAAAKAALATATAGIAQLQTAIAQTAAQGGDTTALRTQLAAAAEQARSLGGAANAASVAELQKGQGTNVEIRTNSLTGLVGVKLGANKNIQVYGGGVAQRLNGEVHLRGTAYQAATGYDAKIATDTTTGYVVGASYSIPKIALKAALTYRSQTEHESTIAEAFPALGAAGVTNQDFKVTLPESYNLDFQTGINPTTLLTAKVRYVPWSDFSIEPPLYTQTTKTAIASYSDDQWSGELGIAKKLNDKFVVSGNLGYDSGSGNPASTLGPVNGYYSVGLGARYNVTPEWSVSAGGKYLQFGDATANLPNGLTAGKFADNDGFIAGIKIAYQSK